MCVVRSGMLYKWWAVSLTQFTLVLFSDLDVHELLRPEQPISRVVERWKSTWHQAVPAGGKSRFDIDRDSTDFP